MATVAPMPTAVPPPQAKFQPRSMNIEGQDITYSIFEGDMEKPLLDKRTYQLVRLANDLEALVISDPETDKASAAMDVRVGHLSDPADLPGMAHFCEHLLFMGTKKYPRENEYSEFLSNHSGSSNAFTSLENTNYFFDVGHNHLEGALDRFAQFFLEPLFDPSCTEREIRAVDSEHKKNLQSDLWRSFQLEKSLCDHSHAYSKFGTGNLATLWEEPRSRGVDIRDELLQFHAKYYSANMMKLVVLGRESVNQLMRWVVEKFSRVPNKGCDAPSFPGSPLGEEQRGTEVMFRTIKDVHELDILFPFPEQVHLYRSKPGQLISHFLGHEGHGSLFSCLKQRGWVNELSAGSSINAQGFELFKIHMALTHEGYAHYEDVVAAVFQFLHLLRARPIESWMYEEVRRLSELRFTFKEKSSPALYGSGLASQMQQGLPPAWLLSGPYILREFDADLIQSTLACLSVDNCRIMLAGREPPAGVTLDRTETWYGTEYTVRKLRPELLQQREELQGMALPQENSFIPNDLQVLSTPHDQSPTQRPQLLSHDAKARLWHKQDDRFFLPKANVALLLRTPAVNRSPRSAVLSRLVVELVKDALCEYSYDADVAGLHYMVDSQMDGVDVIVSGYNDKLPKLLQSVLDALTKLQVDPKRFEIIKDQVRRNYQNFDMEEPFQHAAYYSTYLLTEQMWTQHEKLQIIDDVKAADVQAYIPELCGSLFIDMLVHGNMSAEQARSLLADVQSRLAYEALPYNETLPPRSLMLAPGSRVSWRVPVANPGNVNSSLEYFCQVGDPNDVQLRARLALFAQIANEPCFDQLRTKEQLGYLVYSGVRMSIGQAGFHVIVQSERDSDYLESRVDAFLAQLLCQLRSMRADEFEAHRRSLIHKRLESVKNLAEETNRFWRSIRSGYFDFLNRERDVAALKQLSLQDMIAFMEHYICPSSPHRAKTVTHLQAQTPAGEALSLHPEVLPALFQFFDKHGVPIPADAQEAWAAQLTSPGALTSFVKQVCAEDELPSTLSEPILLAEVERLLKALPSAPQAKSEAALPPAPRDVLEAVDVSDVHAFKAGLTASAHAEPVLPMDVYQRDPHTMVDEPMYLPVHSANHRAQL
ncbi:insulysin [Malassezia equina]|uniref:Insulysin n=1 Tax=Malassezia equina TaxID=1381935 RepID=A0AAF0EGS2_9BASI|nr:insulysin [Malassezia equina]